MMEGPNDAEYRLIARCLMENGILIGNNEEIWTHSYAWRALGTFRACMDAITLLIGGNHSVKASFVKSCVMQLDGVSEAPYCLDELAEFLVEDPRARDYWQTMAPDEHYPHACPHCGAAAFIGFLQIDCKARCQSGS